MLFKDILNEKHQALWPEFEQLYYLILKNQTHDGDMLLVHLNAFYHPEVHTWDNIEEKLSPYMFGPNREGHSEYTHYDFIGHYVTNNTSKEDRSEYLKKFVYSEERREKIDKLNFDESISIQTEMLIYLKIWESDIFIKKFYQLANLINKQNYDWHFSLTGSGNGSGSFVSRSKIIREKIINRFKDGVPGLYASFEQSYISQIRNAIAHSQYSIMGRNIQLNNYVSTKANSQLRGISFDEWAEIFHETIVLYTSYHKFLKTLNENYGTIALQNEDMFLIRIMREHPIQEIQYLPLYYRDFFKDWGWQRDK